ncbi:Uncharacterized protein HZ326_7944 [Fusarium oxysporum f. sp. albedinis]|nr:Uncharacterized protein HZ326_7944 [Fusarium oxysporum f. sp. albedinis]
MSPQIWAAGINTPPSDKPGVYTRQSGIPIVKSQPKCSQTIPHDLGCVPKRRPSTTITERHVFPQILGLTVEDYKYELNRWKIVCRVPSENMNQ